MRTSTPEAADDIPLTTLVKRTLHEIGAANRNDIAGHLGMQESERPQVSRALNTLKKRGEISRADAVTQPILWRAEQPTQGQRTGGTYTPPTAKNAMAARARPATTPSRAIRSRQQKSDLLERLAGQMNDEISALLLEINRDLLTADGSIPS